MSRIAFVMLHPGFIRYYEGALHALADAGHQVHVAFEISRDKLGEDTLAQRLASKPGISCGVTPSRRESVREFLARADRTAARHVEIEAATPAERREQAWESLATTVRLLLDYVRFFEPAFAGAERLRDRAAKRLPKAYVPVTTRVAGWGAATRRLLRSVLTAIEGAIPTGARLDAFVRDLRADVLLVTPLIELGSQQVDYVKCAQRQGVRSALCVASWDNLTSKGLIRVAPDHVVVWNDVQRREAIDLHGVPAERVVITGAQLFDRWFAARPSRSREEFCMQVGLDPAQPYVLYVGSSTFIAPEEVPFAERWISYVRRCGDPLVSSVGVLVRPHPANSRQWRVFEPGDSPNVTLFPAIGSDPNSPDAARDYFDSLYYSAAVVGINTSAQLEAGIVGRPVLTIRDADFAHSQQGTLHFKHLVSGESAFVLEAHTLDEHIDQLATTLRGESRSSEANARLVRSFIRPRGAELPATPVFVEEIGALAALGAPVPRRERPWSVLARPFVYGLAVAARALAEDRPLWIYATRPFVSAWIHLRAAQVRWDTDGHERRYLATKRFKRRVSRTWYESTREASRSLTKMRKRALRTFWSAYGAIRRG